MAMHPAVVQLILELSRDFPDASISEIARVVDVAVSAPFEELDSPIEALRPRAAPLLESILSEID